ncbi:MAG: molybdopterin-dependent oxidoreductase [Acidimicrobiia bacterium]|nr:molybdopterin-dependent oxidoreductase [Acidimicrobiia bacterium]
MSILGTRVLRREDPDLLTGSGSYVDNLQPEGLAHVTYVTSPVAHARVTGLDLADARGAPGVLGVYVAADLETFGLEWQPAPNPAFNKEMRRPYLARDEVRYVGEPVAAVVTEHPYQGPDAADLVVVDYEPLPPVVDPEAAARDDGLAYPEAGTNLVLALRTKGEPADFGDCDVVVSSRLVNQRVAPAPIEGRTALANWSDGPGSRIVQWASCQGAHPVRDALARAYGLEQDEVRVISRDVGGSFGTKMGSYAEEVMLPALSALVGRPVRWTETRSANMVGLGHGRAQTQTVTIGGTRQGDVLAYRLDVIQDAGAYPAVGAVLPAMTSTMLTGVYDIPRASFTSRSVATNTTPVVSYRGAGRPEATAAIERAIDLFAAEAGLDPAVVRRRNFYGRFDEPIKTIVGTPYDSGDYAAALELALHEAGYAELRDLQQRRRQERDHLAIGIGMAVYVEITAYGGGGEYGSVDLRPDGTLYVRTGSSPFGQGHHTSWAMLVSERTGVPLERIEVFHGDTDLVPQGGSTGGSRSLQIAGASVNDAALRLVEQARRRAANVLEASFDDVVLDAAAGRFHVAGVPTRALSWEDLAEGVQDNPLAALSEFSAAQPTFPFGAHVCVVEVDLDTGKTKILRHVAVDDAGVILNPMLVEGQVHGGLAQGAAQALQEEFRYDEDGNPLTANFIDYYVLSAADVPSFERVPMETPTPINPLGAKGIGESGTIGATPAVQNAVIDALAHLGVRHVDMPCTPERVWAAVQGVAR